MRVVQLRATERKNASHVGIRDIKITLNDLNDELPIFDRLTPSNVSVSEDVVKFASIATVHATDRDTGDIVTLVMNPQSLINPSLFKNSTRINIPDTDTP